MNLNVTAIPLTELKRPRELQVREAISEQWVEELRELYRDGHELPPGDAVRMSNGDVVLVDGFHRAEAFAREFGPAAGFSVRVFEGDVTLAKRKAAAANKHGLPRQKGDKARAIQLMLETPEGQRMTTRQLARHCGVSQRYVVMVKNDTLISSNQGALPTTEEAPKRKLSHSAAAARAALRADSDRTDKDIATEVGCAIGTVRKQRHEMGLPVADRRSEGRKAADEYLEANPTATNDEVVENTCASRGDINNSRRSSGIKAPKRSRAKAQRGAAGSSTEVGGGSKSKCPVRNFTVPGEAPEAGARLADEFGEQWALQCALVWRERFGERWARQLLPAERTSEAAELVAELRDGGHLEDEGVRKLIREAMAKREGS